MFISHLKSNSSPVSIEMMPLEITDVCVQNQNCNHSLRSSWPVTASRSQAIMASAWFMIKNIYSTYYQIFCLHTMQMLQEQTKCQRISCQKPLIESNAQVPSGISASCAFTWKGVKGFPGTAGPILKKFPRANTTAPVQLLLSSIGEFQLLEAFSRCGDIYPLILG